MSDLMEVQFGGGIVQAAVAIIPAIPLPGSHLIFSRAGSMHCWPIFGPLCLPNLSEILRVMNYC